VIKLVGSYKEKARMGKSLRWLGCAQSLSIYLGARFGLRRTARRSNFSFSPPVICAVCSCNMRLSASFWPTFITTPPPPWELAVLHFHSVRTQFSFQAVLYCPSSIRRTSGQVSRLIPFLIINIVSAHLPHCAHSYLCVGLVGFYGLTSTPFYVFYHHPSQSIGYSFLFITLHNPCHPPAIT
jgi:hypothetical protein